MNIEQVSKKRQITRNKKIHAQSCGPVNEALRVITLKVSLPSISKGPSIYDVHREGSGSGGRMGEGGQALCGRPHRKLKLESTNVILSSSPAKKLAYFLPEFRLWTE